MYYYIVATLPYLRLSGTTETDIPAFLAFTRSMLPPADYKVLQGVSEGKASIHPFAEAALGFEQEFAAELARNRALNLGLDPGKYPHSATAQITEKARQLAGLEDPLEAETAGMQFHWDFLENLESGHYFDLERLVIHLLKLILLERKNKMTEERGTARYAETYQRITKPLEDADVGV